MSGCNYKNPTCNTCNIKIRTLECNPGDRNLWTQQLQLNEYGDNNEVVKSNIVNGCWECNYDDLYEENSYLCRRSLYQGEEQNPHNYVTNVNLNSCLLNINKPLSRHLPQRAVRKHPDKMC